MCFDDEVECDQKEPVSSIKPVPSRLKCMLHSNTTAHLISGAVDWNVIDLLNDISEIQFGHVTMSPVNVEVRERERERMNRRRQDKSLILCSIFRLILKVLY